MKNAAGTDGPKAMQFCLFSIPEQRVSSRCIAGKCNQEPSHGCADVALVTPLRDGMNLVAKEYVASQDPEDPGVLILSRFAGAAVECEAALLVNPYDPESVGSAIAQPLSMPLDERRGRHDALFQVLMTNDVQSWGERFLIALTRPLNLPNWLGQTDFSLV